MTQTVVSTLLIRRFVCLSCDIPPGYHPLVIDTVEGLKQHRQTYPDHFLSRESIERDDLQQNSDMNWYERVSP